MSIGYRTGTFIGKYILKGNIICLKQGVVAYSNYLKFSNYNVENLRSISRHTYLLDQEQTTTDYTDFLQDPLDSEIVNSEFRDIFKNRYVALIAINDVRPGQELFISFHLVKFGGHIISRRNGLKEHYQQFKRK